nr:RNA polymerase sigma-70 factor [Pedobacter mongoliensis]
MHSILKDLSDEELLELLRSGQVAPFEELYNRYWSRLYSSAFKRVSKAEVAEEIVQDFFTSLWINRETLVIHSSFNNYMHRAVRNLVFKFFQKEYSHKKYQELVPAEVYDSSTEEEITYKDLIRTVEKEVDLLPPKCRGVYQLSRQQFKSNKEIAHILQISEKTVENHITKALKVLRLSVRHFITIVLVPLVNHFF